MFPGLRTQTQIPNGIIDFVIPLGCLIECKLSHHPDAYYQLQRYARTCEEHNLFPLSRSRLVEICRNYDPFIRLPVEPNIVKDLKDLRSLEPGYHVYIWSRYDSFVDV